MPSCDLIRRCNECRLLVGTLLSANITDGWAMSARELYSGLFRSDSNKVLVTLSDHIETYVAKVEQNRFHRYRLEMDPIRDVLAVVLVLEAGAPDPHEMLKVTVFGNGVHGAGADPGVTFATQKAAEACELMRFYFQHHGPAGRSEKRAESWCCQQWERVEWQGLATKMHALMIRAAALPQDPMEAARVYGLWLGSPGCIAEDADDLVTGRNSVCWPTDCPGLLVRAWCTLVCHADSAWSATTPHGWAMLLHTCTSYWNFGAEGNSDAEAIVRTMTHVNPSAIRDLAPKVLEQFNGTLNKIFWGWERAPWGWAILRSARTFPLFADNVDCPWTLLWQAQWNDLRSSRPMPWLPTRKALKQRLGTPPVTAVLLAFLREKQIPPEIVQLVLVRWLGAEMFAHSGFRTDIM